MMWVLDFLPGGSVLLLETGDQLLRLGRELQFRMGGGKQQDVGSGLADLWRLLFNGEVSAEERYQVDGDQRQGNNRQAPRRHILVFNGEKHDKSPFIHLIETGQNCASLAHLMARQPDNHQAEVNL